MKTVIIVTLIIIFALVFIFLLLPFSLFSAVLYTKLLIRTTKKKWGRECAFPNDLEYKRMFDIGIEWGEKYAAHKTPVNIKSGRYSLFGEYFDFGGENAVIIIAGRTESLLYSYYFAEPYRRSGYNVLVIDNRAHGLSSGRVNSLGYREYKDILAWGRFLHDELGNGGIVLHGICIGSSTALFALTDDSCPDYMRALIAEGMYTTFSESLINNIKERNHRPFPIADGAILYTRIISGADIKNDGPIKRIEKMHKPILFLHSQKDTYSEPQRAQLLFDTCPADKKRIVWFDEGIHSRIRINNEEKYDKSVVDFLSEI